MLKKILSIALAVVMIVSVAAFATSCGNTAGDNNSETTVADNKANDGKEFKVGFIFLHDENSTYDLNFINAVKGAQAATGLTDSQVIMKTNFPEGQECYEACEDLVDQGCSLIFADSFGHETYLIEAAKKYTDVQFCHATGTRAHTEGLSNYHNAFASIYEGRYLAGVAAGLKLNEMIANGDFTAEEAVIGYVGAFTYAEVVSGYTSFFLGARSVCPTATMKVQFTGSWYDEAMEKEAANALIAKGCKLISQHADSMGAPTACEAAGVPNVSYNGSTVQACPKTFIISSAINWQPYMELIIKNTMDGKAIDADWTGTLATGSVVLSDINTEAAAAGTAEKLAEVKNELENGTLKVFDTSKFTISTKCTDGSYRTDDNGKVLVACATDTDSNFANDTDNAIIDGAYQESYTQSAPSFVLRIDGIKELNANS